MKVAEMMRLMFTPINPATVGFSAVARMARPSLVKCTNASSPAMISADTTTIRICTFVIVAPPKAWGVGGRMEGTVW